MLHLQQWFKAGGTTGGGGDPHWGSVISLLHMNGTDGSAVFNDETGHSWTAHDTAQIDTAEWKFNGSSGLFDGTSDFLDISDLDFDFGSGDFCWEFFIRPATVGSYNVMGKTSTVHALTLLSNVAAVFIGGGQVITGTTTLNAGQWYHYAFSRTGNDFRLFIDGVQEGGTYSSGTVIGGNDFGVASLFGSSGVTFNGHMAEVRITKGVSRYTSNFSPPAAPFPNF